MINAFTSQPQIAEILRSAAASKQYGLQVFEQFDVTQLRGQLPDSSILIFDLSSPELPVERVVPQLDALGSDELPPILYILGHPGDVKYVAAAENIVNQDYTFPPVTMENIALRLEVLNLLGQRRRMTLESAITDRLTGLSNRKYFLRRLEEELYRAERYKYGVGVILADVDFSVDGGELSEDAGTAAIKRVAEFFRDRLRKSDVISRFRWSEFGVLLPNIPAEDSVAVATDLKQKIEALDVSDGKAKVRLRASVGHVMLPSEKLTSALEVIEAVEDCAFAAKGDAAQGVVVHAGS